MCKTLKTKCYETNWTHPDGHSFNGFPLFSQTTSAHTSTDSEVDSTGWKSLMDMPTGRFAHSATVFDGKIYVFGGLENGYGPFSNSVEVYDPASDTWTKLANMPTPRCHLSTSLLDGKIYAIGGWSNPTDRDGLKTVEVYDPISDSWVKGTDMPLPRLEFHSCVFDDKIYVFGGLDATEKGLNRVEVYDPESDTWNTLADMPTGRCAHSCILKDSLIYVLGGTPGVGPYFDTALNVVEIYNPRTDTWEEGVEMPKANPLLVPHCFMKSSTHLVVVGNSRIAVSPYSKYSTFQKISGSQHLTFLLQENSIPAA